MINRLRSNGTAPGLAVPLQEQGLEPAAAMVTDTDVSPRRCWRCLQMFPGDPTRAPTATPEWWLCDPCDHKLLARGIHFTTGT